MSVYSLDTFAGGSRVAGHGVTHFLAEPGDGWRYEAFVVRLPRRADGGSPESHVHVSVTSPVRWSHTFAREGTLHASYVREKIGRQVQDAGRWTAAMTAFVAAVLERPAAGIADG